MQSAGEVHQFTALRYAEEMEGEDEVTIPAVRLDKLNAAIKAADLSTATDVILPPDCDEIRNVAKHPGEHYIAFMDSERIEDSATRTALQKVLSAEGFTVCAHGVYWKEPSAPKADSRKKTIPPDANGTGEPKKEERVETPAAAAPESKVAEGAGREANSQSAPDAAPTVEPNTTVETDAVPHTWHIEPGITSETPVHTVATHTDAAPVKPRIEVQFFLCQLSNGMVGKQSDALAERINDGWKVAHEQFQTFDVGQTPIIWYVARLEREV